MLVSGSDEEYDSLHSNALSQSSCFLLHHWGCATLPDSMAVWPFVVPQQASLAVVKHPAW